MPTALSPLEEVLFQSWARAHGVDNHDDPNNQFDHRGLYKQSNGLIMPGQAVRAMADAHNKAMEPQEAGGDVVNPDPYMAAAEMHGNQLKAQGDQAKLQAQSQLEDKKHQQKVELEQMKLAHAAAEKDKDRQYKAKEADRQRQVQAQQAEQVRQQQMQDAQMQRQQQVEDTQMGQQHDMQSTLMQEQLARSRPQPEPTPQQGMQGGGQQMQGSPQGGQMPQQGPPPQSGGSGLQNQLMQRQLGSQV